MSLKERLTEDNPPKYCRCGKKLLLDSERGDHDPITGLPEVTLTLRCPLTKGFFNRVILTRHVLHDEWNLRNNIWGDSDKEWLKVWYS